MAVAATGPWEFGFPWTVMCSPGLMADTLALVPFSVIRVCPLMATAFVFPLGVSTVTVDPDICVTTTLVNPFPPPLWLWEPDPALPPVDAAELALVAPQPTMPRDKRLIPISPIIFLCTLVMFTKTLSLSWISTLPEVLRADLAQTMGMREALHSTPRPLHGGLAGGFGSFGAVASTTTPHHRDRCREPARPEASKG